MTQEKLVLLKPRSMRLAEYMMPALALPVGPVLREVLGSRYSIHYGFLGLLLVALVFSRCTYWWAASHGGRWVSASERRRLLALEARSNPPWPMTLIATAAIAIMFLGLALIQQPLDQLGNWIGGPLNQLGLIAVISALIGSQTWSAQRRLARSGTDQPVPQIAFWLWLRRTLPLTLLAYGIGNAVAIGIALSLKGQTRWIVFIIISIVLSQVLRKTFLSLRGLQPTVAALSLRDWLIVGVALWGFPMAITFLAILPLLPMGAASHLVQISAIVVITASLGGLGFGALMYLTQRLGDPQRNHAV